MANRRTTTSGRPGRSVATGGDWWRCWRAGFHNALGFWQAALSVRRDTGKVHEFDVHLRHDRHPPVAAPAVHLGVGRVVGPHPGTGVLGHRAERGLLRAVGADEPALRAVHDI